MKKILIELRGEHTVETVFRVMDEYLHFAYGRPGWDSIQDALIGLDWLPANSVVVFSVMKDFKLSSTEETRLFFGILCHAYVVNNEDCVDGRKIQVFLT